MLGWVGSNSLAIYCGLTSTIYERACQRCPYALVYPAFFSSIPLQQDETQWNLGFGGGRGTKLKEVQTTESPTERGPAGIRTHLSEMTWDWSVPSVPSLVRRGV